MFEQELLKLEQQHLLRKPIVIESCQGPRITVNNRSLLLMCSNDYLGLAHHPALRAAAILAAEQFGFGTGASRLTSGTGVLHQELEDRLALFKGTEAAILFNSGYAANTGAVPALVRDGDAIFSDGLNHASIIDGCRLSKAFLRVYRHKDMNHLEKLLATNDHAGRRLIITDGVFSMDGDIAPIPDLVSLAEKYDAMLMVDDAHATGVLGAQGRGTTEHFGLQGRVPIQMGTLGKSFGSFGAYIAGSKDLIALLVNRSRSYVYSTSLPPAVCGASLAAIKIVEHEPQRRADLWKNRDRFISGLRSIGISTGASETPIVPLMIGNSEKAIQTGAELFKSDVYATAIRPPTVPEGTARIRMTVMSNHSDRDIDAVLDVLHKLKKEGLFS